MKNPQFTLSHLGYNIYHMQFERQFDLCMQFWRVTETTECPAEFKDKYMTLANYMDWYSHQYESGHFSYTQDWNGFNVTSRQLWELYSRDYQMIEDVNEWDVRLKALTEWIKTLSKDKFSIIGTHRVLPDVLNHEIAHALYYLNSNYKKKQDQNIERIILEKPALFQTMKKNVLDMGYSQGVCDDELQAYLSTGPTRSSGKPGVNKDIDDEIMKEICKPFEEVFANHVLELKLQER